MTGGAPLSSLRDVLRADAARSRRLQRSRFGYVPVSWWLDPGFVAVLLHRLAHAAHRRGGGKRARLLMQLNSLLTGADFHPASRIGPGLLVPSPCATNLSGAAGRDLTLMALAGIGGSLSTTDIGAGPGLPLLGDAATVGRFAGVNGPIVLGDRVLVDAGAGAVRPVPADHASCLSAQPLLLPCFPVAATDAFAGPACDHRGWRATWRDWQADLARLAGEEARYDGRPAGRRKRIAVALTNPMAMMLVQRIAHHLHCRGARRGAALLAGINRLLWKITAPPHACIGGGVLMPHLAGLVIDGTIGRDATLYANTLCCGWDGGGDRPVIGDRAILGGHAGAIGAIRLAAETRLAPKVQLFAGTSLGDEVFSPMARFHAAPRPDRPAAPTSMPALSTAPAPSRRSLGRADRERMHRWAAANEGGPARMGALAVRLHRHAHDRHARGHRRRARWTWLANVYLTGADLSPASRIGPGLLIPYPAGVAFHGTAGAGLTLMAMSGVGADLTGDGMLAPLADAPRIGDDVRLDHHALIHGPCRIGDGVRVMPGCRAAQDTGAGLVVAPRPTRIRRAGAPATVPRR